MRESLANIRDLGGLPTADGGLTASGVLLRGDAPYSHDDLSELIGLPVTTVIDLRSRQESERLTFAWPADVVVHRRPLYDPGDIRRYDQTTTIPTMYAAMLAASRNRIACATADIGSTGATLIHCTAGKDRTGLMIAALLMLVGVPAADVVTDYERSTEAMPQVIARADHAGVLDRTVVRPEWMQAPGEAIAPLIDELTGHADGARGWFLEHGALASDLDRFIGRMTSPR